jgi:CO/xanthine dehydrogenase Mo-binding subunit
MRTLTPSMPRSSKVSTRPCAASPSPSAAGSCLPRPTKPWRLESAAGCRDGRPASSVRSFAIDLVYDFPNFRVEYVRAEPPVIPTAFWRSVGPSHNVFVAESFIDELAAAAKQDPVAYRRALLGKSPRAKAVLDLAAEKFGWGQPVGKGIGGHLETRTRLSRPSNRSLFAPPIPAGKRFGEPRDRAGLFGDDRLFCPTETGLSRLFLAKGPGR